MNSDIYPLYQKLNSISKIYRSPYYLLLRRTLPTSDPLKRLLNPAKEYTFTKHQNLFRTHDPFKRKWKDPLLKI